jgi:lysozyme
MRIPTLALLGSLTLSLAGAACTEEVAGQDGTAGGSLGSDVDAGGSGSVDQVGSIDSRVCAAGATIKGVDVSYYQGTINWTKVKAAGIDFAFVRVSDGDTFKDPKFAANWSGTKAAGVIRGAYQFFRPSQSISEQAQLMISAIGTYTPGDLPPVLDVEVTGNLSPATVAANVRTWVDKVHTALGVTPIIYTGMYFWRDQVGNPHSFDTNPLWIAQYTSECPDLPTTWAKWQFWQYADQGSVSGITGSGLDMDRFNGTLADLQAFANGGGTATPLVTQPFDVQRADDGTFTFDADAGSGIAKLEIRVDDYLIGAVTPTAGACNLPYTFSQQSDGRVLDVRGLSASGATISQGNGVLDSTAAPGVYARQTGDHEYEMGLEAMDDGVAAVEVWAGDSELTDLDTNTADSTRGAVRYKFSELGDRDLTIYSFDADGNELDEQARTLHVR